MTIVDDMDELIVHLRRRLAEELPGTRAHRVMAPRPRRGWRPEEPPDDSRPGAGLVYLYPRSGVPHLLLTVRRGDLGRHPGQVSLPGGAVDRGEELVEAALREAREEVALDPRGVRVLGRLTPLHIPVSRFLLHPVVGHGHRVSELEPAEAEVDRLVEVPLSELANPRRLERELWQVGGGEVDVPFFRVRGVQVWGATAMVLSELMTLLGAEPRPPSLEV